MEEELEKADRPSVTGMSSPYLTDSTSGQPMESGDSLLAAIELLEQQAKALTEGIQELRSKLRKTEGGGSE